MHIACSAVTHAHTKKTPVPDGELSITSSELREQNELPFYIIDKVSVFNFFVNLPTVKQFFFFKSQ